MKPPPDRAKRSIFLFKLKNPIRQICITVRWQNHNKSYVSYTDPRSWNMFDVQIRDPTFDIQFPDHGSKVVWNLHPVSNHGNLCVFSGEHISSSRLSALSCHQSFQLFKTPNSIFGLFLTSNVPIALLVIMNNEFYCWIIWQIVVGSLLWLWFISYFPSRLD